MELRSYLRVMLRGWWLILSTLLIAISAGLVFTYSQTPIYRSTATFVASPSSSLGQFSDFMRSLDSLTSRNQIILTYIEIATSKTVLKSVHEQLGLTKAQIENMEVSGELVPSTNIIKIIVESDDPLIAQMAADLVGQKAIEYMKDLYEPYDIKPLDPASPPKGPSKPQKAQNLALAGVLGLVVGVGSAFLLEYLRSSEDVITGVTIVDGDTGVYNRYYFLQRLGEELSRANRHRNPLSLAMMQIEHLDAIGDMRLPRLRNEVLRRVALFLKRYLREEDVVARFEGDKFALLLPDTPGPDAKQILEKLHNRLEWNIFELEERGIKLNLTASSGLAVYSFNGAGRDDLLAAAEKALQHASQNADSKVHLFSNGSQVPADKEMEVDQHETTNGK
ncbi:MAG: hypothetical protein Kow0063_16800 [Anaerolineae bacterium]